MEIIFTLCRETAKSAKFIALKIFVLYGSRDFSPDTSCWAQRGYFVIAEPFCYILIEALMTVTSSYNPVYVW